MITVLEYIWITDKMTILRLLGLHLLEGSFVETLLGVRVPGAETPSEYERLMRAPAYRRARGGALRQVRFG
ncbi:MAG TPA: hypothetical protein GX506_01035 [Firmicutes bacterium]|nr:hypothetical protein [Bacillota bacterium]